MPPLSEDSGSFSAAWLQALGGLLVAGVVMGCAGSQERALRSDLKEAAAAWNEEGAEPSTSVGAAQRTAGSPSAEERASAAEPSSEPQRAAPPSAGPLGAEPPGNDGEPAVRSGGQLEAYLAQAYEQSPALRAEYARWQAEVHQIASRRRLPNPVVSFGYFVRSVETRVGPQRARLGVQQSFPWPSRLTAGADAAAERARASQMRFDAAALRIGERVQSAYWSLWTVRTTRELHRAHLEIVQALAQTVLARVATGQANLADQQQVNLTAARLEDRVVGMGEQERAAAAALRAVIGLEPGVVLPTEAEPPLALLPAESEEELRAALASHPLLEVHARTAAASEAEARAAGADRLPSFSVGADWIVTDRSSVADVPDSGKDAVVVGGAIQVPLWQGNVSHAQDAARAEAAAARHARRAALDDARADLASVYSQVRDASRRVDLFRNTLLPQAESAYESVLGAYTAGEGTVAQALLAQQDLLDLRVELETERARHAVGWARLEWIVGRAVRADAKKPVRAESERTARNESRKEDAP